MIGNAISTHILEVMQGICQAAKSMNANVLFFLGIHCGFYYKLNELEDIDKDFDYQFNTIYDYQDFADIDALIIEYGSLGMFLNEAEQKDFLRKFGDIPRVILEERYQSTHATAIITDNYHGMYSIAEHLIRDHGYRDITYQAGPKGNTDAEEREKRFWMSCSTMTFLLGEDRILYGNFSSNVQKQVNELLDRFPHMEAMICANDNMADTAYKECLNAALPSDVTSRSPDMMTGSWPVSWIRRSQRYCKMPTTWAIWPSSAHWSCAEAGALTQSSSLPGSRSVNRAAAVKKSFWPPLQDLSIRPTGMCAQKKK